MWPTPTPIPTSAIIPTPPVDPSAFTSTIASGLLQGWQMFDSTTVASLVWFIVVAIIIFAGIISIRRHLESL